MKIKQLNSYINEIKQGKPIFLAKFSRLISQLSLSHDFSPSDITARKIKNQLYVVLNINEILWQELQSLATDVGEDRISAARQNLSHNYKVDGSILIARKRLQHPKVVLFDRNGNYQYPDELSLTGLIIENRQNFISTEQTLAFLQSYTEFNPPNINEIDIIFADGNEISNSLHKKFLECFGHLYLSLDLDLGGLKIAKNLISLLPEKHITFLLPKDIQQRISNVVKTQTPKYLNEVMDIGIDCPQLAPYAKLIKDNQRILEQESFLYDE